MKNTTAIVISFLRPGYAKACIESLRKTYPEIKIIVGENGEMHSGLAKYCKKYDAEYIDLPYDSGVCVGRNKLMERVETEYVLVGDDDFFYTPEASVDEMKMFLEEHKEFDLIGGRVSVNGLVQNYQGFIEKKANHFQSYRIDPDNHEYNTDDTTGIRYCPADLTFNYFVARTEKVRSVPWDEKIKVAYEHFSWFYDFKCAGGKVAFTPDAVVVHKPEHVNPDYQGQYSMYRNRKDDKERFFSKYEIDYIIGMNGVKTYSPHHVAEIRKNDTKYVDFCITTFKRPKALERLLFSIAEHYPMANVYIADQNLRLDRAFYKRLRGALQEAGLQKRISIEHLPYDCGLSYARNHLMTTTPNQYKLLLDDDMEFSAETDISKFVALLDANPQVGIVGGKVRQLGYDIHFEFDLLKTDGQILQVPDKHPYRQHEGITYKRTSCVLNFALMRKDLFRHITWDRELKVAEHTDFYLRMKHVPYHILYTPDVVVEHPPTQRERGYKEMRQRSEFVVKMLRKHKVRRMKYLNGQVTELMDDGSLKRYKEQPSL